MQRWRWNIIAGIFLRNLTKNLLYMLTQKNSFYAHPDQKRLSVYMNEELKAVFWKDIFQDIMYRRRKEKFVLAVVRFNATPVCTSLTSIRGPIRSSQKRESWYLPDWKACKVFHRFGEWHMKVRTNKWLEFPNGGRARSQLPVLSIIDNGRAQRRCRSLL